MNQENVVLLRVQLSKEKVEEELQELVLNMEKTRAAQAALTLARKQGTVADEEYKKQSVALALELKSQRGEYAANTKNLELFRKATGDLSNSYAGQQAQLSLAQRQFQQLAGSQDLSTESARELNKVITELRGELFETDKTSGLFARGIGNYPKGESLQPLIQQIVKLQEEQKSLVAGSEEEARSRMTVAGFQTQAIQAAAKEGLSYEQTTAKIAQYSAAIQPAVANLVQLEKEQQEVAAGSEAFNQIGFRIAAVSKEISSVPAEVKGVTSTLTELDSTTDVFGGHVAQLKERFTQAKQGIELARGGLTGFKGALAATGVGVFILALGVLYEYFTKTDEGAEQLAAGLAFLKGLLVPLETLAINAGKGLVKLFTDPLEAGHDLLDFIEGQVVNRVKALGVIFDALKSGDFKQATNGVLQYATGVEDVIGKTKELAAESAKAAKAAYDVSLAQNTLEDAERDSANEIERNKNLIDKLVLSAKDRNLTEAQRLANLDKAGQLEKQNLAITTALAAETLRIAKLKNDEAERSGKTSDELRDAVAAAQTDLTRLAGQSASLQQSIQNRRSALLQQEAADDKAATQKAQQAAEKAAEARIQARRDSLALEEQLLEQQLKQAVTNSDEELSLLQQKLRVGQQAELNVKNLTLKQKQAIDVKYETDSLALSLDFNRRRLQAALQAQLDLTGAQLAGQQAGSAEALRLQAEQIEQQRTLALAGLAANADNTAKIAAINATAAQQQRQAEYADATKQLNDYLAQKRQAVELDYAKGVTQEGEYQRQLAAVNKAGIDAQAVVNADYQQDNSETQRQATDAEIEQARRATAATKLQEQTKQEIREATVQAAIAHTDTIINLFGEESAAGQAALAIKKVLGLAEIALNLQKELAANKLAGAQIAATIPPPVGLALGTAYVIAKDALAITSAAAGAAAILKLQQGGIAQGASHEQGGIHLYRAGRPTGIEIEGGEPVLTRNVTANPLLLSLASTVNQLAGGRALVPNFPVPRMAMGGVAQPLILDQLQRGQTTPAIDYERLARTLQKVNLSVSVRDTKEAAVRDDFAQSLGNS